MPINPVRVLWSLLRLLLPVAEEAIGSCDSHGSQSDGRKEVSFWRGTTREARGRDDATNTTDCMKTHTRVTHAQATKTEERIRSEARVSAFHHNLDGAGCHRPTPIQAENRRRRDAIACLC